MTTRLKVMAPILGPTDASTKDTGRITTCMAKELTPGPTDAATKVAISWTRSTASESINGLMAAATKATGAMESNTVRVATPQRKARCGEASGMLASGFVGSMMRPAETQCSKNSCDDDVNYIIKMWHTLKNAVMLYLLYRVTSHSPLVLFILV